MGKAGATGQLGWCVWGGRNELCFNCVTEVRSVAIRLVNIKTDMRSMDRRGTR